MKPALRDLQFNVFAAGVCSWGFHNTSQSDAALPVPPTLLLGTWVGHLQRFLVAMLTSEKAEPDL